MTWILKLRALVRILTHDQIIISGAKSGLRLIINLIITLADFFPGFGEILSWLNDGYKILYRTEIIFYGLQKKLETISPHPKLIKICKRIEKFLLQAKEFDPSKDVALWAALGSEALEFISFSLFPSHLIELIWQTKKDWPALKKGMVRLYKIRHLL